MRIKEENNLAKQIKLEEKRRIKDEKKLSNNKIVDNQKEQLKKSVELDASTENAKIGKDEFRTLAKKIIKRNALRQYTDINNTQN